MRRTITRDVFLVERFAPGRPDEQLSRISSGLRDAVRQMNRDGVTVRYLQSVLLADEESCLCLFAASSAADVAQVNERAGLPFVRIVPGKAALESRAGARSEK